MKGTEYVKFVIRKWEGEGEGVDISVTILTAGNGVDKTGLKIQVRAEKFSRSNFCLTSKTKSEIIVIEHPTS